MGNFLSSKGLRVVNCLILDIVGIQEVADPLGYSHGPLLSRIASNPMGFQAIALPEVALLGAYVFRATV